MANATTAAKQSKRARRDGATAEKQTISSAEIQSQIAIAAYYRALQRGFTPGFEVEDWVEAETEVLKHMKAGPSSS